jgi:glycosyltransferase involved in cell wall biosynthesis
MRFHIIGLPHTATAREFSACAFTTNALTFCGMMHGLGHEVFHYGGEGSNPPCTEHVDIVSATQRRMWFGDDHNKLFSLQWEPTQRYWQKFNNKAIEEIRKRIQPHDFLCFVVGPSCKPIMDAFPQHRSVEYAVGYNEMCCPYRVYPSHSHRHWLAGKYQMPPSYFDEVIPHAFDVSRFPAARQPDDYYLFVGRLITVKGMHIAADVCTKMGKRLLVVGQGGVDHGEGWIKTESGHRYEGNIEYLGAKLPEERNALMAGAQAMFAPTQYHEPFGMVTVEANLCGCPVITPDWGAFTETVVNGVNGYRTRSFAEMVAAVSRVRELDRSGIKQWAADRFSSAVIARQYEAHFTRLSTLWGDGWYTLPDDHEL